MKLLHLTSKSHLVCSGVTQSHSLMKEQWKNHEFLTKSKGFSSYPYLFNCSHYRVHTSYMCFFDISYTSIRLHSFKVKLYHTHLFTPFNDTTAQVSTGLWVDHGKCLLVNKEFLTAFCLFPEINT